MKVYSYGSARIDRRAIVIASLLSLMTPGQALPSTQPPAQFDVVILKPTGDDVEVEREIDVEGTAHITTGNHLWVLIHRISGFESVWWPQDEAVVDSRSGQWTARVTLGVDVDAGYDFGIAAITVDEEQHLKLQQYRQNAMRTHDWKPMAMPPTSSPPVYRRVKRFGIHSSPAQEPERVFGGREVDQKARILSKPEPQYTEEARRNLVSGTVVVRAVFAASGQVANIRAVNGLPNGLTEKAIAAARQIKFRPAMKDGRPASMYMQIEYTFDCIYGENDVTRRAVITSQPQPEYTAEARGHGTHGKVVLKAILHKTGESQT